MEDKKEKTLEKIKKLLALSKSDNVHESARALAQVQKMMQMYNLEESDIENSYINSCLSKFKIKTQTMPHYLKLLAGMMKLKFAVEIVALERIVSFERVTYFDIYGFGEKPEIATYVFDFLARKIQKDRNEFTKSLRKDLKRGTKTEKADAFCMGWLAAVNQKLDDYLLNKNQKEQINDFIKKKNNGEDLGEAKIKKSFDFTKHKFQNNISQGYKKGEETQINHGIKNGQKEVFRIEN